ncbi:MAG: DUF554 domain-containing protein [Bacteroidota bacterium]
MTGTWINVGTILLGGSIGLLIKRGLRKDFVDTIFQALGLYTILLGVSMGLKGTEVLVIIIALAMGAFAGEGLKIDQGVRKVGDGLAKRFSFGSDGFTQGFSTAFLLFCIGPMSTLGAIDDGLGISMDLLLTKSTLDGVSSMVLTAAFGVGVIFCIVPLVIIQGGTSLLAEFLAPILKDDQLILDQLQSIGGVMLIGVGINILDLKQLKVMNMLPALVFVVLLVLLKTTYLS